MKIKWVYKNCGLGQGKEDNFNETKELRRGNRFEKENWFNAQDVSPDQTLSPIRTAPAPSRHAQHCFFFDHDHLTFCHPHYQHLKFIFVLILFSHHLTGHTPSCNSPDFIWHPLLIWCLFQLLSYMVSILLRNASKQWFHLLLPPQKTYSVFPLVSSLSLVLPFPLTDSMFLLNRHA